MTAQKSIAGEAPSDITREEYVTRVTAMLQACQQIRDQRGWCEQWIPTVLRISPHFRRHPGNRNLVEAHVPPEDMLPREMFNDDGWLQYSSRNNRLHELQLARGRILRVARDGTISLDEANQVITAMGLDGYRTGEPRLVAIENMFRHVYVDSTATAAEIRVLVGAAYQQFLDAIGQVRDHRTGQVFTPEQLRISSQGAQAEIPASECSPYLQR